MKIFRKICVGLLLGIMATQFVLADDWADEIDKRIKDSMEAKKAAQINGDLIKAIEDRDLAKVKQLIKLGADVNARVSDKTPLGWATGMKDNMEIVKYLISKGADINAKIHPRIEESILENILQGNVFTSYKLNVAKYLILQGANIGDSVLSRFLINEKTWQFNEISYNDIIDMVKLLVSKGANLNNDSSYDSDYLDDVLIFSRKYKKDNSQKLLKYLIKAGANPNVCPNRHSNTLLGLALGDIVSYVSWDTHKNGVVTIATSEKQVKTDDDVAQWLIDNGADVNLDCGGGYTALTVASSKGNLNAVKWLVSKGAKDIDNALKEALASQHYDVAEFLMEKGAKKE